MSGAEAETPLGDDFYQDQLRGYYVVIHLALTTLGESLVSTPVLDILKESARTYSYPASSLYLGRIPLQSSGQVERAKLSTPVLHPQLCYLNPVHRCQCVGQRILRQPNNQSPRGVHSRVLANECQCLVRSYGLYL